MKYNWSIIGHEKQLIQIEKDIESGNLSHAYLLAGPNSVGKSTVAKKMAGILQCNNNFCHKCKTCIQIQQGNHLDTSELRGRDSIKIEDIRKLIERVNMTSQSSYKIFFIQTIERMTIEAANSFLKALEEPPPGTIFILTTNNIRELLPTIVSRVRVLKFSNVSAKYLVDKLRELYPDSDEDTIRKVSLFSLGKTGKALHLMENPDSRANYLKIYNDVQNFLKHRSCVDRFVYVENLLAEERQVEIFLNILIHVLRSKMLEGSKDVEKHLNTLLKIEEAGILLKKNINARLVLENLMLVL
jgi:replication-associated recombination protein RarA